jgi:hypothetical protein
VEVEDVSDFPYTFGDECATIFDFYLFLTYCIAWMMWASWKHGDVGLKWVCWVFAESSIGF